MNAEQHYLRPLFEPSSLAIIGATERQNSIAAMLVRNMLDASYLGRLFFVNPKHKTVFGQPCHRSMKHLPKDIELAVICTPAHTLTDVLEHCGRAGIRCVMILSEHQNTPHPHAAAQLERSLQKIAKHYRIRLIGPGCQGILRPHQGINLNTALINAHAGSIGLISQSGALSTAFLDWAFPNKIGFSAVAALNSSSDIDFGDILDYLVTDPRTKSILLYIETIQNARRFMSALRSAARCKPVLILKVGRHPLGVQATQTHIGIQTGADDVFEAALRRTGAVRLYTIGQMYATAQALLAHFRPRGNRLAIITNGGGPGVMAADHAGIIGIPLSQLSAKTLQKLANHAAYPKLTENPINLGNDADPERYATALQLCQEDENVDGVLALLTPQACSDPSHTARTLIQLARTMDKPLVTCWMGEQQVAEARLLFNGAGIPSFRTPEPAVDLFSHISQFFRNQQLLMQTPPALAAHEQASPPCLATARQIIAAAQSKKQQTLSAAESKAILATFQIPMSASWQATSATDQQENTREFSLSIRQDKVFGPFITLTPRHSLALRNAQRIVALPPLNRYLINDMLTAPALELCSNDGRGSYPDLPALKHEALISVLLRISEIACELPEIHTFHIASLIVNELTAIATDAEIILQSLPTPMSHYAHMAIHPYPAQRVSQYQTHDGQTLTIRPIRPEDADLEQNFVQTLSTQSRYFRFMNSIRELSQAQLTRLTQIDYDREMAFVAINTVKGTECLVGVARYATQADGVSCEFSIVIADAWQRKGIARQLMQILIETAKNDAGLKYMTGEFLVENQGILQFAAELGFSITPHPEDHGLKQGVLVLN